MLKVMHAYKNEEVIIIHSIVYCKSHQRSYRNNEPVLALSKARHLTDDILYAGNTEDLLLKKSPMAS